MRTLTLLAVVGVIIPSLLSLFQNDERLSFLERIINSLARMVKLCLVLGFVFGAIGLGTAITYYVAPMLGFTVEPDLIELSETSLKYYGIVGVLMPILGILVGSFLAKRQSI
ncbi:hypothetical protein [Flammeovirga sp. EKP202]|uniref:hypothetical protein n=1 Tax=Flammeovirga sp. EKP202 TaxID=2770592 RepID=UPI00165F39EA|nr:hypothetical protein [Flammeovirga sp. EKP202]MBD0404805.1 hypothetical protein [Flammeovirga sp. EKP202]